MRGCGSPITARTKRTQLHGPQDGARPSGQEGRCGGGGDLPIPWPRRSFVTTRLESSTSSPCHATEQTKLRWTMGLAMGRSGEPSIGTCPSAIKLDGWRKRRGLDRGCTREERLRRGGEGAGVGPRVLREEDCRRRGGGCRSAKRGEGLETRGAEGLAEGVRARHLPVGLKPCGTREGAPQVLRRRQGWPFLQLPKADDAPSGHVLCHHEALQVEAYEQNKRISASGEAVRRGQRGEGTARNHQGDSFFLKARH